MAVLVTLGSVALAVASLRSVPDKVPQLEAIPEDQGPVLDFVAPEKIQAWFSPKELARPAVQTNSENPFFTRYFEPPPKPAPPPPATTRQTSLLFQGMIRSSQERPYAFIVADGKTLIVTNGAPLVADLAVARIELDQVVLTNVAGLTNILPFRKPAQVEVPLGN
ncbi:MAG: hypothetical protein KDM81_02730 [Verrucomicrobiae bacterium]|nr:hypothetical protein [Verrucomicrobiae bacterium]